MQQVYKFQKVTTRITVAKKINYLLLLTPHTYDLGRSNCIRDQSKGNHTWGLFNNGDLEEVTVVDSPTGDFPIDFYGQFLRAFSKFPDMEPGTLDSYQILPGLLSCWLSKPKLRKGWLKKKQKKARTDYYSNHRKIYLVWEQSRERQGRTENFKLLCKVLNQKSLLKKKHLLRTTCEESEGRKKTMTSLQEARRDC